MKDVTYAYLILSKKKAYFTVNSVNPMICNHKTLRIITENLTTDLISADVKKRTFQVLPDKTNRGRYFTIDEKEREGFNFNIFEISVSQIDKLRNRTIKSLQIGEDLNFELDEMSGRKMGKMFDCVE